MEIILYSLPAILSVIIGLSIYKRENPKNRYFFTESLIFGGIPILSSLLIYFSLKTSLLIGIPYLLITYYCAFALILSKLIRKDFIVAYSFFGVLILGLCIIVFLPTIVIPNIKLSNEFLLKGNKEIQEIDISNIQNKINEIDSSYKNTIDEYVFEQKKLKEYFSELILQIKSKNDEIKKLENDYNLLKDKNLQLAEINSISEDQLQALKKYENKFDLLNFISGVLAGLVSSLIILMLKRFKTKHKNESA